MYQPLARTAVLNDYISLMHHLGADPAALVRAAGLDVRDLSTPGRWIPVASVSRLLAMSAEATGHEDFGLLLAEGRRLSNMGPVSLAAREEPDVRSALRMLIRHEHLHNEALRTQLTEGGGLATIHIATTLRPADQPRQAHELITGAVRRFLTTLIGRHWQPVTVDFAHPAPADLSTHHRLLGPHIRFDQDSTALACYTADLDASNTLSDPLLRPYARAYLDTLARPRPGTDTGTHVDQIREIIGALLPTGRCSLQHVARTLCVDRKTVHRHLARDGQTYSSLQDDVRADLAEHHVSRDQRPLNEIAELLGFTSLSTFSRWFRHRFGTSATAWRAGHRTAETHAIEEAVLD